VSEPEADAARRSDRRGGATAGSKTTDGDEDEGGSGDTAGRAGEARRTEPAADADRAAAVGGVDIARAV